MSKSLKETKDFVIGGGLDGNKEHPIAKNMCNYYRSRKYHYRDMKHFINCGQYDDTYVLCTDDAMELQEILQNLYDDNKLVYVEDAANFSERYRTMPYRYWTKEKVTDSIVSVIVVERMVESGGIKYSAEQFDDECYYLGSLVDAHLATPEPAIQRPNIPAPIVEKNWWQRFKDWYNGF
jgi:hypothetical protein